MARRKKPQNMNDDLLLDETLGDDSFLDDSIIDEGDGSQELSLGADEEAEEWDNEDSPGQLAVDIYETPKKLIVKARVAGINRDDLDVSITDNKLTISGTLSSGDEIETENFHVQECYWGEFQRDIALPVSVKEDEVDAVLKDGVLTISFNKVKQETVKKIQIS